jgi:hypothetical protein
MIIKLKEYIRVLGSKLTFKSVVLVLLIANILAFIFLYFYFQESAFGSCDKDERPVASYVSCRDGEWEGK